MSFQKFHVYGSINRDTITNFASSPTISPTFNSGETVFDRTQENNMAWIDGLKGNKGIMKSGDMFTTQSTAGSFIFQFSWVTPRTGINDNRIEAGQNSMSAGDGSTQTASGDCCLGFTYNVTLNTLDLTAVQFVGVCEMRATGTYDQAKLITGAASSANEGKGTLTNSTGTSNAFGIQLNEYNYSTGGYILAKVNATEKY
jgi:hypothetical protein